MVLRLMRIRSAMLRAGLEVGAGQPDSKFLPADPCGRIHPSDLPLDDSGEMGERRIAGGMSEGVVEVLEFVEVGVDERAGLGRALPRHQLLELPPVEQSGEPIGRARPSLVDLERTSEPRPGAIERGGQLGRGRAHRLATARRPDRHRPERLVPPTGSGENSTPPGRWRRSATTPPSGSPEIATVAGRFRERLRVRCATLGKEGIQQPAVARPDTPITRTRRSGARGSRTRVSGSRRAATSTCASSARSS